jgi:hypothetical protein
VAHNGLEQLVYEIGQRLGQVMVDGLHSRLAQSSPALPRRGPGRPRRAGTGADCLVPRCGRSAVAKKLCPTHYRKAHRLKMGKKLTAANLAELAEDGRKTRWEKAA